MTHTFQPRAKWRPRPDWPTVGFPGQRWYSWGDCRVMAGVDPDGAYHLSISCPSRYPTWEEIKQARYDLCPADIHMAMILPPKTDYVNIHDNCFHLHQIFPGEMVACGN